MTQCTSPQGIPTACSPRRMLREAVSSALDQCGRSGVKDVSVGERESAVYLQGPVPSFHAKQLAQEIALSVPGVMQLHNHTIVTAHSRHPNQTPVMPARSA